MSGDPFKKLHEQKTRRMQQRVAEAHRKALTGQTQQHEEKNALQPSEGQVFEFKDEAIRSARNAQAKKDNADYIANQIKKKQQAKERVKTAKLNYERK